MAKRKGSRAKAAQKQASSSVATDPKAPKIAKTENESVEYTIEALNSAVASLTSIPKPLLVKLCRLCESKDGPFLNIFDTEKVLAKKINRVLPIVIDEYDKLPHKICFRCSAKVEELHEFVEKCIRTQENLKKNHGESKSAIARKNWEEKLKESKQTNDDYCESLIKKAIEKIGPVPEFQDSEPTPLTKSALTPEIEQKEEQTPNFKRGRFSKLAENLPVNDNQEISQKPVRKSRIEEDKERTYPVRSNRSRVDMRELSPDELPLKTTQIQNELAMKYGNLIGMVIKEKADLKQQNTKKIDSDLEDKPHKESQKNTEKQQPKLQINKKLQESLNTGKCEQGNEAVKESSGNNTPDSAEYENNIMQHVCTIKVGGAGLLYQCKLCKRNFLKKEVVLGHNCAKARQEIAKASTSKSEPKLLSVKSNPSKQSLSDKEIIEAFKLKTAQSLSINSFSNDAPPPSTIPRSKPGPASKKKLLVGDSSQSSQNTQPNQITPPVLTSSSVEVPNSFPGSKNRYKLVPGPNNTYTLIEDEQSENTVKRKPHETFDVKSDPKPLLARPMTAKQKQKAQSEIINLDDDDKVVTEVPKTTPNVPRYNKSYPNLTSANEDGQFLGYQSQIPSGSAQAAIPYPVGLFQTIPQSGAQQSLPFSTVAMKKHSYSVVQTGNPGKLLISNKQPPPSAPEVKTTKAKKSKKNTVEAPKQPFQVTIEDSTPAKEQNDGFFTFINVDPLLQPSYVLPTSNIIQESQISTSTPASEKAVEVNKSKDTEVYTCEMCHKEFSREKKLLAHLQTHYSTMDDIERSPTKRTRKS